jgi:hypothetical protein
MSIIVSMLEYLRACAVKNTFIFLKKQNKRQLNLQDVQESYMRKTKE